MKKVTAFVGNARKKNTYKAVVQFMKALQSHGDIETEIVRLSDYHLEICKGCQVCFRRGEAFCPLKDDRDVLFDKINTSDGVVFAAPNYSWHLSGMMKVFLDRFGFAIHRPRYCRMHMSSASRPAQRVGYQRRRWICLLKNPSNQWSLGLVCILEPA